MQITITQVRGIRSIDAIREHLTTVITNDASNTWKKKGGGRQNSKKKPKEFQYSKRGTEYAIMNQGIQRKEKRKTENTRTLRTI